MNRAEMLAALRLSESEFSDLLQKLHGLFNQLNVNQQNVVKNSMVSVTAAAASFGPTASVADVQSLLSPPTDMAASPTPVSIVLAAGK